MCDSKSCYRHRVVAATTPPHKRATRPVAAR